MNDALILSLIIIGVIAAIVAALMAISRKDSRAKKSLLLNTYKSVLDRHKLTPDHVDEFRHRIIGMDMTKKVFVAVQHDAGETPYNVIQLNDVTDCNVRKSGSTITTSRQAGSFTDEFTDTIALSFVMRNGMAVDIPVYTDQLDGLAERIFLNQSAEKWRQLVRLAIGKTG